VRWSVLLAGALLGACATYAPLPLPQESDLAPELRSIRVDSSALAVPALQHHGFDPSDGLDAIEVAMLAVINNPDLQAQRRKAGVTCAQVFAAGLLPDPQLSLTSDHPNGSAPGLTNAVSLGLNYDLTSLVTRGEALDAARAAARQVDLDLLWQEWQVAQQAQVLYVHAVIQAHKLRLLREAQRLYANRYASSAEALRAGRLTLDVTGTDLTALMDANSRVSQMLQDQSQTRHELNALLGLAPGIELALEPLAEPPAPTGRWVAQALTSLGRRRPDLLALQAGYRSQEAQVRRAVLAQFPALSVGYTGARDTGDVHTTGLGISLSLPVLNGNRGEITVQRATRAQLRQEYQARLDTTHGEIDRLQQRRTLLDRQLAQTRGPLPELERMVALATRAYGTQNISALTYLNMTSTLLSKRLELDDIKQAQWETIIALDTLLAWPGPDGQ
jgi:cobalt-zinc-cadmium efflux system outer membrane protein